MNGWRWFSFFGHATTVVLKTLENPLDCKEIKPVHPKGNQFWIFIGRTDAEAEALILWQPNTKNWLIWKEFSWCWERLEAGEEDDRGWDGWIASPTQWTWVWASSGSWWWTGKPGVLQSMGSQSIGHNWATELNCHVGWIESTPSALEAQSLSHWANREVRGWVIIFMISCL